MEAMRCVLIAVLYCNIVTDFLSFFSLVNVPLLSTYFYIIFTWKVYDFTRLQSG